MPDFDSFVVLAEMRTGSNFLESNLNALNGVTCHGEAFNPHFIGSPKDAPILGVDRAVRDAAPLDLLELLAVHAPAAIQKDSAGHCCPLASRCQSTDYIVPPSLELWFHLWFYRQ